MSVVCLVPLGAGPALREAVNRLVDRQGVAESSRVQGRSIRSPLAGVSSDDGGIIATPALVSRQVRGTIATLWLTRGMGRSLLPRSSVDEDSSHRTAWMEWELTHGWVEEHAKGVAGLSGKSWSCQVRLSCAGCRGRVERLGRV